MKETILIGSYLFKIHVISLSICMRLCLYGEYVYTNTGALLTPQLCNPKSASISSFVTWG